MHAAQTEQSDQTNSGSGWCNEPWTTIFDLRERDSAWLDSQQTALVKAFALKELDMEEAELEGRLVQLSNLLPDIGKPLQLLIQYMVAEQCLCGI